MNKQVYVALIGLLYLVAGGGLSAQPIWYNVSNANMALSFPGSVEPGWTYPAVPAPPASGPAVLYRINVASGGGATALDAPNPDWAADDNGSNASPYRTGGSKTGGTSWDSIAPTVPAYVPTDIFKSERSDPGSMPDMEWDFPVSSPGVYEVHLFFMNNYGGTSNPGQRIFDVELEGAVMLDDYDIVADVGHKVGTMKTLQVSVTDGNLDIDFRHVKQDPLVNGIEIIGPVLTGPSVSISSPANGSSFSGDSVAVTWLFSGLKSSDSFRVSLDGQAPVSVAQPANSISFSGLSSGSHSLSVVAVDSLGTVYNGVGDTVSFVLLSSVPQPQVALLSPVPGVQITGDMVTATWTAGNLLVNDQLVLVLDGLAPVNLPAGAASYTWTGVSYGAHSLTLSVEDLSGQPYGNPGASSNVNFQTVQPPLPGNKLEASFVIHPNVNQLINSTYSANSFRIYNDSDAGGMITSVVLNIGTAAMPEMVFDPFGTAGDPVGKNFTIDTDPGVGYLSYAWGNAYGNGGYQSIAVNFNDFGPGEWFGFSADIDPTSSEGLPQPGPNHAATISGVELIGGTVTVTFSTGETYTSRLFSDGSLAGVKATLKANPAPTLNLAIQGAASPATVSDIYQTLLITGGEPNGTFALYEAEAAFFETAPGAQNQMPYEINGITSMNRVTGITLDGSGSGILHVYPRKTRFDAGYNLYLVAATDSLGFGPASNPVLIRYNPGGDATQAFFINCGGNDYVSQDRNVFDQDTYVIPASSKKSQSQNVIQNTPDQELYHTDRWNDLPMGYALKTGNGLYEVTLMFAETKHDLPGKRLFGVDIEGVSVLTDFDINAEALADPVNATGTGKNFAITRTFYTTVTDSILSIDFIKSNPTIGDPKVNAIVVRPVTTISPPSPTISIVAPASGEALYGNAVTLSWLSTLTNATDQVSVTVDGSSELILPASVTSAMIDSLVFGPHSAKVQLLDNAGQAYPGVADSVAFVLNAPLIPTAAFTSPADGDSITGNQLPLQWVAGNLIAGDQFRIQVDAQGPVFLAQTSNGTTLTGLASGAHVITLSVVNSAGVAYASPVSSDQIGITMTAPLVPLPSVTLMSPAPGSSFLNGQVAMTWTSQNLIAGDQIQVSVNGNAVATLPGTATNYLVTGLLAGSYTLGLQVVTQAMIAYPNPEAQASVGVQVTVPSGANVLYRVNAAGGSVLASLDAPNPDWSADNNSSAASPYRNSGSKTGGASWDSIAPTVPAYVPTDIFKSERSDPSAQPEMQWDFPVPSAGVYEVHLFFMNNYGGTKNPGQRIFDVEMEGTIVLNDYDIVADVGHKIGTMKGFQVQVTDGNLDLNFFHVKQDPLINGIEIVGPLIMGPQMSISQPTDGSMIPGQDLAVSWTYSNLEATDVFLVAVDGQTPVTVSQPGSSLNLSGLSYGVHTVAVSVADQAGVVYPGLTDSATVTLMVPPTPSVLIVSPSEGDTVTGNAMTVTWTSNDLIAGDWLLVYLDGLPVGQVPGNTSSFAISGLTAGDHQLVVTVADQAQVPYTNTGASDTVNAFSNIPATGGGTALYRIDVAGSGATALDAPAIDWSGDGNGGYASPYRNSGSNISSGSYNAVDPSVPAGTPLSIFAKYRWDAGSDPDMQWDFPVTNGLYEVRLYFLNSYSGTSAVGKRVFDVIMEGQVLWDNLDLIVEFGHLVAGMKSAVIAVNDGNLDLDFGRVVNDPIVSGIEIIQLVAGEGMAVATETTEETGSQASGEGTTSIPEGLMEGFVLQQNRPNPFSESTEIEYSVPVATTVRMTIYNAIGQEIRMLEETVAAGDHSWTWDRSSTSGAQVANGLYHLVMTTSEGFVSRIKIQVVE